MSALLGATGLVLFGFTSPVAWWLGRQRGSRTGVVLGVAGTILWGAFWVGVAAWGIFGLFLELLGYGAP